MCHIAFWEPHFGAEFETDKEWLKQSYRLGAKLHPLTIEQNALTSFRSRTSLVPCRANTVGPALLFEADYAIGGADGAFSRGMQWQGHELLDDAAVRADAVRPLKLYSHPSRKAVFPEGAGGAALSRR